MNRTVKVFAMPGNDERLNILLLEEATRGLAATTDDTDRSREVLCAGKVGRLIDAHGVDAIQRTSAGRGGLEFAGALCSAANANVFSLNRFRGQVQRIVAAPRT